MAAIWDEFMAARLRDLDIAKQYAADIWQQGSIVAPSDAQLGAVMATVLLAGALNVVLALLVPRGRKLVLDTAETILATVLIIVLLTVVLGLPLAIIYLILKAAAFLLTLVLGLPVVANLVASARGMVGL